MIGIDTNVLIRFLVDDDEMQNTRARSFMAERTAENPAFLSAIALAETVWVLRRQMQYPLADIVAMIRALLSADNLVIEHTEELDVLVNGEEEMSGDLADHLIAWSGNRAGCTKSVTFDIRAARAVPGMELLQ